MQQLIREHNMPHKGFSHPDPANKKKNGDSAMHEKLMSKHINFLWKRGCHPRTLLAAHHW
jgi:hypothetical protein